MTPRAAPGARFRPEQRVRRKADFELALAEGIRATDERLTLWARPNGLGLTRLGLMVGRKHGNAPARNRAKRVLRAAFRLVAAELPPGLDLICGPRVGVVLALRPCMESLRGLSLRLVRRIGERG